MARRKVSADQLAILNIPLVQQRIPRCKGPPRQSVEQYQALGPTLGDGAYECRCKLAPHYHDMGLVGGIIAPLCAGFPVTLLSQSPFEAADPLAAGHIAIWRNGERQPQFRLNCALNKLHRKFSMK